MSNVFFPDRLSTQGFLNDFILAQIRSNDFPFADKGDVKGLKSLIYGYDFIKKLKGKLFYIDPKDRKQLLQNIVPKTAKKGGGFLQWTNEYIMRRYLNFLNNMTPVQQAALVPYIRLYVKEFENNTFVRTKEIVFNREYKIPNSNSNYSAGGGRGNAGIESLSVDRDFQYYGYVNRFNVQMDFIFDSFDTFANGMQYENALGSYVNNGSLWGQDQGAGYISLIKKGSERTEKGYLREYLILEYGYKFPDTISEEIVSQEDRLIFEMQEKKELRITCFKHDFKFSETGEVRLSVSYVASADAAMASKNDDKTNDVFLINNDGVIRDIMDEPSEEDVQRLDILKSLQETLNRLKFLNDRRKDLTQNYCSDGDIEKTISGIDKEIQEINKNILSIKKYLLNYMYYFFLRYFMTYDSLWTLSLRPIPLEIEKSVLNPCNITIGGGNPTYGETLLFINKISKKRDRGDIQFGIRTNYNQKITEIIEKGVRTTIDNSTTNDLSMKEEQILKRFGSDETNYNYTGVLNKNFIHESYSCYQALQTFTLSRLAAQDHLIKVGKAAAKCEDLANQPPSITPELGAQPSQYSEKYGNITFFPLRALIAAAIDFTIDKKEDENNFPIICLDSVLTDSMGKNYIANIGDLLVDIDYFKEWLMSTFINMEKLDPTLDDFLGAIFEKLVPSILKNSVGHYLKGDHGYITKQTFDLSEDVYNNYETIFADLVSTDEEKRKRASERLAEGIVSPTGKTEIKRPLIIYYQESYKKEDDLREGKNKFLKNYGMRTFDKKSDYEDGIYHVAMGQSSGIVKSINFSYMNDAYLNTLFAMKNPNHLAAYLKYSYEANIEFVGNDLFFNKTNFFAIPRNQFSVSPTGLNFTPDKDLFGLSGYYQVSKTTDKISMGEYTTSVVARNMFSPTTEEHKSKRCKTKNPTGSTKTPKASNGRDDGIPLFVTHDIAQYIFEAIRDVPAIASKFNVKIVNEKK